MIPISQIDEYSFLGLLTCGNSKGTAFIVDYQNKQFLVTDRHVIYKTVDDLYADFCSIMFYTQNTNRALLGQLQLDLKKLLTNQKIKQSEAVDLLLIEIDDDEAITKFNFDKVKGVPLVSVTLDHLWGRNVMMYGYPTSIRLRAPFDFKPFITSGIVSAIDEGTQQFVIDSPAYYGNSGGPVFRKKCGVSLIGVVQRLVPFNLEWHIAYEDITRTDWHNTGYSICRSSNEIIKLIEQ